MTDSKTVKVVMTGYERVQYQQSREIPVADWLRFQAMFDSGSEDDFAQMADLFIDRADVCDTDGIEDFEMRLENTDDPRTSVSSK
jgi:hypothetical protein